MSAPSGRRGVSFSHDAETRRKIANGVTKSVREKVLTDRQMREFSFRYFQTLPQTPDVKEKLAELSHQVAMDGIAAHAEESWDLPAGTLRAQTGKTVKVGAGIQLTDEQRAILDDATKTGPKEPQPPTTGALTGVANHLADAARTANGVGLIDEAAELMQSSRDVRLLTTGSSPRTLADILKACTPIVAALRGAGQGTSADNLEKTLEELAAVGGKSRGGITTKSSADAPVAESPLPEFDARFAVINPPAAIPTNEPEPETYRIQQGQTDEDGPELRGIRIVEDGS